MNWFVKVAAFKLLSVVPGGAMLYKWSQKNVTHSLTLTPARARQKIEVAVRYLETLERERGWQIEQKTIVDLGSGWHPTIPLFFYACGCDRQWLLDVAPVLDDDLIAMTVKIFSKVVDDPAFPYRERLRRRPPALAQPADGLDYLRSLGIEYRAPYAGRLGELDGAIDVVTSSQVLLHIPPAALADCVASMARLLRPRGQFLATVYLRDLFVGLNTATQYRHLRFSTNVWERVICSSLMGFNRLKAPDYRALLESNGLTPEVWEVEEGAPQDLAQLQRSRIDPVFAKYAPSDLAARHLYFAARKR